MVAESNLSQDCQKVRNPAYTCVPEPTFIQGLRPYARFYVRERQSVHSAHGDRVDTVLGAFASVRGLGELRMPTREAPFGA